MPLGIQLNGVRFSQNLAKALPPIPNLMLLTFFGSDYDGINSNRAPGGPDLLAPNNSPVMASNYATFNQIGLQATASATTSGGAFTGITVSNSGSLYTTPPLVTCGAGPNMATAIGSIDNTGKVTGLTSVTVPGSGWTDASPVTITGGNYAFYDTQIARASILSTGWTWACVARSNSTAAANTLMTDARGASGYQYTMTLWNSNGTQAGAPTLSLMEGETSKAVVTLPSATTNWRFAALTYTGGTNGDFLLYSMTDNLNQAYSAPAPGLTSGTQTVSVGAPGKLYDGVIPGVSNAFYSADVSFTMVCGAALSGSDLQTLYGSVQSILGRRHIVC